MSPSATTDQKVGGSSPSERAEQVRLRIACQTPSGFHHNPAAPLQFGSQDAVRQAPHRPFLRSGLHWTSRLGPGLDP